MLQEAYVLMGEKDIKQLITKVIKITVCLKRHK